MLANTPFRMIEMLGSCQVGTVWSAVDDQGRQLTVAVLTVGTDARWRDAFAAAANSPDQPRPGPPFLYSDFTAADPWVAYPADGGPGAERIFLALGQQYHPATPGTGGSPAAADEPTADVTADAIVAPGPWMTPPQQPISPTSDRPGPVRPDSPWPAGDRPTSGGPVSGPPTSGPPISGQLPTYGSPVSGPPVSGPPTSGQPFPYGSPVSGPPVSSPPTSGQPFAYGGPRTPMPDLEDPFTSPVRRIQPVPRKPRRTGRWIAIAAVVGVLVAGSGAFAWWTLAPEQPGDDPLPTAAAESAPASASVPAPPPPRAPGIEPPKAGEWPAAWPRFAPTDRIRTLAGLDGLGFTLKIPMSWECVLDGRGAGFTRYRCGVAAGGDVQTGGELIVRDCPDQCPKDRQTTMRQAEEAWGLQWTGAGPTAAYAESSTLQIDGKQQYGLVVVAYWRAGSEGAIDRQVVLRMTAPVDGAGQLRRVANYVRDTTIF